MAVAGCALGVWRSVMGADLIGAAILFARRHFHPQLPLEHGDPAREPLELHPAAGRRRLLEMVEDVLEIAEIEPQALQPP